MEKFTLMRIEHLEKNVAFHLFRRFRKLLLLIVLSSFSFFNSNAQTTPLIPAGTVGNTLGDGEIPCAAGSDLKSFNFSQDGGSPFAGPPNTFFGEATAVNGVNSLGLTWEYEPIGGGTIINTNNGVRTNTAQNQTATMTISFDQAMVNPIIDFTGLQDGSTIELFDCSGNPLSPVLIAETGGHSLTGNTLTQTDGNTGRSASLQLPGSVTCFNYKITSGPGIGGAGEGVTLKIRSCVEETVLPPCTTCGPNQSYEYLTLTNASGSGTGTTADVMLNGVLYGDAEVLFSNLSINEDLSGSKFGAFANGNTMEETFILQVNLCAPITVQQVDILGLETESQVWVGTGLSGAGSAATPSGLTFAQCGGGATMVPTGNMVTNTAASCLNQGNGNYTVGGTTVSTLYFKYNNPAGGCKFDKATFRIGACVPDGSDVIPTCPLTEVTFTDDPDGYANAVAGGGSGAAFTTIVTQDANGNYFNQDCGQIQNEVNNGTAIPVAIISPCAEVVEEELCSYCDPIPPCTTCGPGETYEYLTLANATGSGTGTTADVLLDGVLYGDAEVLFSNVSIREDMSGAAFGAVARGSAMEESFILQVNLCSPITVQQVDIIGLETESQVWVGTGLSGVGSAATPTGLTLTQCDGDATMVEAGNMVTNNANGCLNQGDGNFTVGAPTVSTLYFRYTNPAGGCRIDKTTFRIGVCTPELADAIPVCPLSEVTLTNDPDGYAAAVAGGGSGAAFTFTLTQDANGNYFNQDCGQIQDEVDNATAIPVALISPCAEVIDEELCSYCDPVPPCTTCGPDETYEYLTLANANGSGTGTTADVFLDGVLYGDAEVLFSNLSINEDLSGTKFGAFANGNAMEETMLLQINLCEPISVQQVDVLGLETESQVWVGTSLTGAGSTGIPAGLTLTQCDGDATMAVTGNMVTNTAASCLNQGDGNYTVGGATVSTLYFRYTNPAGGCKFDKATFRIGVCTPELPEIIPTCQITLVDELLIFADGSTQTNTLLKDGNGNYYGVNSCPSTLPTMPIQSVAISPCATITEVEVCPICIIPGLAKTVSNITPAASGIAGNVDVTFKFTLANYGTSEMINLIINDNIAALPGYVGITTSPMVTMTSAGGTAPTPNAGYAGTGNLLNGTSGALNNGEQIMVEVVVEFDASALPNTTTNSAQGGGTLPNGDSFPLDDSTTGIDPDPNGDGDPSEMGGTNLYFANINSSKQIVNFTPAASGVAGNIDAVFEIQVCNTGNVNLQNLTLVDNLAAQMGPAFVDVLVGPSITASSATMNPGLNNGFNGNGMANLFNGTSGLLAPGECVTIQFTAELNPNAGTPPATNQATAGGEGIDPSGASLGNVSDLSDSGPNPDDQNPNAPGDTGGSNDPTVLSIPQIALTKNFVSFTEATSGVVGNVDVVIEFNIQNTGSVNLNNISLIDDLMGNFGPSYIGVVVDPNITASSATTDPTLNGGFNGMGNNNIFNGTSGLLEPSQSMTILLTIEMDPDAPGSNSPDVNQATATGDGIGPNGSTITVSDDSDDGTNPENNNPNEPGDTGDDNDPSPFNIPQVHLTKDFVSLVHQSEGGTPGNVDITIEYNIENTGNVNLTNIDLIDDLNAAFGSTLVGIISNPIITASTASTDPTLNSGYTGTGSNNMFNGMSGVLEPNQTLTVQIQIELDPNAPGAPDPILNQATTNADGVGPNGNVITVSDDSDSGTGTETTNPGEPGDTGGHNDPTPLPLGAFNIAKHVAGVACATSETPGNFNVIYQVVVENTGNVNLTNFNLNDIMTQFGSALVAVVEAPNVIPTGAFGQMTNATTPPTTNANFAGNGQNLVNGNGLLEPGQIFIIQYTLEINPSGLGAIPSNQINGSAEALGPNGVNITINDLSDSGFIPESTNQDRPGDSGGQDDPTPLTNCWEDVSNGIACTADLNLSADENCMVSFGADQAVEGYVDDCGGAALFPLGGYYTVNLTTADGTPVLDEDPSTPNTIEFNGAAYVNTTLTVEVTEVIFKNSCWNNVTIEDKLIPDLVCTDVDLKCNEDTAPGAPYVAQTDMTAPTMSVDNATVSETVSYSANNGSVVDLDVTVISDHTWVGDLVISVTSPSGTTVELINNIGGPGLGCAGNGLDIVFDDDATMTYADLDNTCNNNPAAAGTFQPLQALSAFNGESAAGDWTVAVTDLAGGDSGDVDVTLNLSANSSIPYPVPSTATVIPTGDPFTFNVLGFDPCGPATLTYSDVDSGNQCVGDAKITRTWVITDGSGNTTSCVSMINISPLTLADITVPGDVNLECSSNVDTAPSNTGMPTEGCTNIQAIHHDVVIDICGGGYKILRTWTLTDWCTNETEEKVQIIKVEDTTAPTISCPADVDANTTASSCTANVALPNPTVSDVCSGYTIEASTSAGVITGDNVSGFFLTGAPFGTTTITYTATDDCGNASSCTFKVNVIDEIQPIAVCDAHTIVALGSDGTGNVHVSTFDDGSSDNCGIVSYEARRMDNPACPGFDGTAFGEYVPFSCCDLGSIVMVELKVTDAAGNSNTCMVEVEVQDKLNPTIICKPDFNLDCNNPLLPEFVVGQPLSAAALDLTGQPVAIDNCSATVASNVIANTVDACGNGEITIAWSATDGSGNFDGCFQKIIVSDMNPFSENSITWPLDYEINTCGVGLSPDDLPSPYNYPTYTNESCSNIAITHEDLELSFGAQDACLKLLRKWIIIDWCQAGTNPDLSQPGPGVWHHTQIIKVLNSNDPNITSINLPATIDNFEANCGSVFAAFEITADDDCTAQTDLEVTWEFSTGLTGSGFSASGAFVNGSYSLTFYVSDQCGNTATLNHNFTVRDKKKPTPVCIFGIASTVMPSSGAVMIWASDFESGSSYDNCTDYDNLIFSFSPVVAGQTIEDNITITCADIPADGLVPVTIYVTDASGNHDYCSTFINVQDPNGVCPGPTSVISGTIENEVQEVVEEVTVNLTDGNGPIVTPVVTGNDGTFQFNMNYGDYDVTPEKDINYLNGVTTYDLVLISKHILGLELLDSPYKVIAADANHTETVTTLDIVKLRALILHIDDELANNTSWRFVDANYVFNNPANPLAEVFPEFVDLNGTSTAPVNFTAIKVGDVNGTASPNSLLGTETRSFDGKLALQSKATEVTADETFTVDFTAKDFNNITGYQFTLGFDNSKVEFVDIATFLEGLTADNFGMTKLSEGVITTSWNNSRGSTLENNEVIFSLSFKANVDVNTANVFDINSRYTSSEAYNASDLLEVVLEFNGQEVTNEFELYQNTPNPFKEETVIGFNLPEAGEVTLKVYDVSGRVLRLMEIEGVKGFNSVNMDRNGLDVSGVLYYQLETATETATKKMILVD